MSPIHQSRRQCDKCPWKVSTDPLEIPNGYSQDAHKRLSGTIAEPGTLNPSSSAMACHESNPGKESYCIGWLNHQLGPGNNLALRMGVIGGKIDANFELDGPQHQCFEDTLPK